MKLQFVYLLFITSDKHEFQALLRDCIQIEVSKLDQEINVL